MRQALSCPPYATFNDVFEMLRYPAGESHVALRVDVADVRTISTIEATARSFDDLAQIVTANRIVANAAPGHRIDWFLPYFPFARHDRRNHVGDGLELTLALDLVRELDVVIADPHSDVAGQLRHLDQQQVVERLREEGLFAENPIVVIPDTGAAKKAYGWTGPGTTVVQALKRRDPATGALSGFEVLADDLGGRPCIIVDDICDGGGTFLGLAAELEEANAGPLTLAVTHGLFTKGLDRLATAFDRIACFAPTAGGDLAHERLTTIPFRDLYEKGSIT